MSDPTVQEVTRFSALFDGYSKAHGRYMSKRKTARGKQEGQAWTVHQPVTEDDWMGHLTGSGPGIGVIPLRDDDTLVFAAIDVDDYGIDPVAVEKTVRGKGLPLIVCRSKSGGAHLYLFLKEPVEADAVRDRITAVASSLGFGGSEIFPKQSYRANKEDIGNWINLPYYRGKEGLRYAIHKGKALDLKGFLEHAENSKTTLEKLEKTKVPAEKLSKKDQEMLEGAPPCLCHFAANQGIPEGLRNETVFNIAIYLKKRFPDNWQDKVQEYNTRYCDPALSLEELRTLVRQLERKEYDLKCKGPYCDRRKCCKERYGVGLTEGRTCEIGAIVKHLGDPVYWTVEIDSIRVTGITTDQLYSQHQFNKLCMEQINRVPGQMPPNRWQRYLDEKLQSADVIPAPADASREGQFHELLHMFITASSRRARHIDEILQNKPWHDREAKEVMFRSGALFEYLDERRFKYRSYHQVWQWLRELGADKRLLHLKDTTVNVWVITAPEFPDDTDDAALPLQQETF